jgi:PHD/YefM family antitoxin component YafN of YafNO toxin-antitoxin module
MLSDPNALEEIAAARDDLAQGRTLSAEEPRAKYLNR